MPRRLLALDLDGTLLRADGTVDARDREAVARAIGLRVEVTLATGRLATGALPTARALGLDAPLVCADGALLTCGRTGCSLEQRPLGGEIVDDVVVALAQHTLAPFLFASDAIHGERSAPATFVTLGVQPHSLLRAWTENLILHEELAAAQAWRAKDVTFVLGVGPRARAEAAGSAIECSLGGVVDVCAFVLWEEAWAVRVRVAGCDKQGMLERLASRLMVERQHVCAVGDGVNDLAMLAWAGHSFAMADAPAEVRAAARSTLHARRGEGGGVAEAVERWLVGER